ncbi:hypothetical protein B0H34DRAFT_658346 [Crassisporium funariophilum]|nr:hypothetical protein B0H34DRAFT_658346 [Crassisporium funariophilum]
MAYNSTLPALGSLSKCETTGLADSHTSDGYFAFARIKGEVCLVQVSYATPASALTALDVKIFRHEFITIFRFLEAKSFHPADICIVEPIDERLTRYEEENETVFLARDLMDRMRKMTDPRRMVQHNRSPKFQRSRQR